MIFSIRFLSQYVGRFVAYRLNFQSRLGTLKLQDNVRTSSQFLSAWGFIEPTPRWLQSFATRFVNLLDHSGTMIIFLKEQRISICKCCCMSTSMFESTLEH